MHGSSIPTAAMPSMDLVSVKDLSRRHSFLQIEGQGPGLGREPAPFGGTHHLGYEITILVATAQGDDSVAHLDVFEGRILHPRDAEASVLVGQDGLLTPAGLDG
jgi:hypothetical protein